MAILVASWNMQGYSDEKAVALFDKIISLKKAGDSVVVFLQESGNPTTSGFETGKDINYSYTDNLATRKNMAFKCVASGKDPTAKTYRCTTAILMSNELAVHCGAAEYFYIGSNRPVVHINCGGYGFASIHAYASSADSVPEVKAALVKLGATYNAWVFGGDFNSEPNRYAAAPMPYQVNEVIYSGSVSRPTGKCNMIFSDKTQGALGVRAKTFDYFFYKGVNLDRYSYKNCVISNGLKALSDHNLVTFNITL